MNRFYFIHHWVSFIMLLFFFGCNDKKPASITDTPTSGTIHISVDESFKPVMEDQIKVFEALYPGTTIIAHYKTEAACFRDLYTDSVNRMIIVTRGLNTREDRFYNDSLGYTPVSDKIATDAITIIVNKGSTDTIFTIQRLKEQLTGVMGNKQTIVFDGLNATSTVRFALDSLTRGVPFDTAVVRAVNSSQQVLNYIATHPDAIGLVGISWIGNPEDTAQARMLTKVKIAYVECVKCMDSPYVKPSQASIISRRYPLVRGLYYIVKENYSGLGSGFASFLKYEKGQLVFRRAYLAPVIDFSIRSVKINEKL